MFLLSLGMILQLKRRSSLKLEIPHVSSNSPFRRQLRIPRPFSVSMSSVKISQRKARVADDIKAFRERLRPTQPLAPALQARSRQQYGYGGETSRLGDSVTQQGYFPHRPLSKTNGDRRPSTTDGVSPRQQVTIHHLRACKMHSCPLSMHLAS